VVSGEIRPAAIVFRRWLGKLIVDVRLDYLFTLEAFFGCFGCLHPDDDR